MGPDPGTAGGRAALPLACTLGPDDGPARFRRWQRLHATAGPVLRLAEGELEVTYRADPGVRGELERLAAAERDCCSFVAWSVGESGAGAVLHVTAPPGQPDAIAPIRALFEALAPARPATPAGAGLVP